MFNIVKDICMIKFNTRKDGQVGIIVQKLRLFIEKCGVVLIPFNDDIIPYLTAKFVRDDPRDDLSHQT